MSIPIRWSLWRSTVRSPPGPAKRFARDFGGFVDPNSLMLDKVKCEALIACWIMPMSSDARGRTADHTVFEFLRRRPVGFTGTPTSYYLLNPNDPNSIERIAWLRAFRARYGEAALTTAPLAGLEGAPPPQD